MKINAYNDKDLIYIALGERELFNGKYIKDSREI